MQRRFMLFALSILFPLLFLGACTHYGEIEPEPTKIDDAYRVQPRIVWSSYRMADHELWTVEGQMLHALHLFAGIADGQSLITGTDKDDKDTPVYKKGMRANGVADLVAASLKKVNEGAAEVRNLRPADFGSLSGFRFDVRFTAPNGLRMRADCLGTITSEGKLHLMVYEGAEEHYFGAYHDDVEAIFRSVELI